MTQDLNSLISNAHIDADRAREFVDCARVAQERFADLRHQARNIHRAEPPWDGTLYSKQAGLEATRLAVDRIVSATQGNKVGGVAFLDVICGVHSVRVHSDAIHDVGELLERLLSDPIIHDRACGLLRESFKTYP
jgi:hypothetical protein